MEDSRRNIGKPNTNTDPRQLSLQLVDAGLFLLIARDLREGYYVLLINYQVRTVHFTGLQPAAIKLDINIYTERLTETDTSDVIVRPHIR